MTNNSDRNIQERKTSEKIN